MPDQRRPIPNNPGRTTPWRLPRNEAVRGLLAFAGGLLLPLAFAPFGIAPLAILSPALLFALWRESPRYAVRYGYLFGVGMFGVGVSWVYVSMHTYGNMPAPLAAFATLLFVLWLSLYPALLGWLQARLAGENRPGWQHTVLVVPALWTLFEWVRGWFLTGFPWLNLGYSQAGWPYAGYAPWLGVYGVSFVVVLSAGLLVEGVYTGSRLWTRYVPAILVVWLLGVLAGAVEWTQPTHKDLRVALVQGNVMLNEKWNPNRRSAIMQQYLQASERTRGADLVIWPEAAIPGFFDRLDADFLRRLERATEGGRRDFLIGVLERDRTNRSMYYNSVISIGRETGVYRKQHLVPFGEFLPWPAAFGWLIDSLDIPMSNFSSGKGARTPLPVAGEMAGISICYEDAFGEELVTLLPRATFLVNVSEDAWFGDSLAPHQRVQMARLRAIETGRPMLRAANTGPSVVIDHTGTVLARSPQFETYLLEARVRPRRGATPYVLTGNRLIISVLAASVLLCFVWARRRR